MRRSSRSSRSARWCVRPPPRARRSHRRPRRRTTPRPRPAQQRLAPGRRARAMPGRPDFGAARALAQLYSPPAQRAALTTLCALEAEIGASLRPGLDHDVAHARLAWWREECARTVDGRPTHPLTRELGALFGTVHGTALAGIGGFVDTAVWDLAAATFESRRELTAYCERWSAALLQPLARLGAPHVPESELRALG